MRFFDPSGHNAQQIAYISDKYGVDLGTASAMYNHDMESGNNQYGAFDTITGSSSTTQASSSSGHDALWEQSAAARQKAINDAIAHSIAQAEASQQSYLEWLEQEAEKNKDSSKIENTTNIEGRLTIGSDTGNISIINIKKYNKAGLVLMDIFGEAHHELKNEAGLMALKAIEEIMRENHYYNLDPSLIPISLIKSRMERNGWVDPSWYLVTQEQLVAMGWKNVTPLLISELNTALHKYGITDPNSIAHFIAQSTQETGWNQWLVNSWESSDYRGAGYLHLTRDYNYYAFATYMILQQYPQLGSYNHAFLRKAQNSHETGCLRSRFCFIVWYTGTLVIRHTTEHVEVSSESALRLARVHICADGSFKHKSVGKRACKLIFVKTLLVFS